MSVSQDNHPDVREQVRKSYGQAAANFQVGDASCGCGSGCGCGPTDVAYIPMFYEAEDVGELPAEVTGLSMGCGDPITLATLQPGQTVLDLGSGGGIDCFLAAKRVGPTGQVIGVDMTTEMIERARANKQKVGAENVEFRLGEIEHLPVADGSVDVIISNCVINLSPDKAQVFREAFRTLKPGGKLAVSDMMTEFPLPAAIQENASAWASCIGGALAEVDYLGAIRAAGFVDIEIDRVFADEVVAEAVVEEADASAGKRRLIFNTGASQEVVELDPTAELPRVFSGKITAYKPIS
jgi:arsenite methyltransferase